MALLKKESIYIARELAEIKSYQIAIFELMAYMLKDPILYKIELERRKRHDTQMINFFEFNDAAEDYPIIIKELRESLAVVEIKLAELKVKTDSITSEPIGF